ncbi:hypothetical protein ACFTWR_17425 [Streptomyces nigra]|uniref:hypothetical protein n=1 Tax=Streptomyces nigra TaxID=1827580 RepID=UPI0030CA976A
MTSEAGRSPSLIIAALSDWGRTHLPRPDGTSPRFSLDESGTVAELAFVTADREVVPPHALTAHRTDDARLGTSA